MFYIIAVNMEINMSCVILGPNFLELIHVKNNVYMHIGLSR